MCCARARRYDCAAGSRPAPQRCRGRFPGGVCPSACAARQTARAASTASLVPDDPAQRSGGPLAVSGTHFCVRGSQRTTCAERRRTVLRLRGWRSAPGTGLTSQCAGARPVVRRRRRGGRARRRHHAGPSAGEAVSRQARARERLASLLWRMHHRRGRQGLPLPRAARCAHAMNVTEKIERRDCVPPGLGHGRS